MEEQTRKKLLHQEERKNRVKEWNERIDQMKKIIVRKKKTKNNPGNKKC